MIQSLTSRSLRMTRGREAETRRIDDSQTRDAKDSCFRVDDRHRLVCSAHHACHCHQQTASIKEKKYELLDGLLTS